MENTYLTSPNASWLNITDYERENRTLMYDRDDGIFVWLTKRKERNRIFSCREQHDAWAFLMLLTDEWCLCVWMSPSNFSVEVFVLTDNAFWEWTRISEFRQSEYDDCDQAHRFSYSKPVQPPIFKQQYDPETVWHFHNEWNTKFCGCKPTSRCKFVLVHRRSARTPSFYLGCYACFCCCCMGCDIAKAEGEPAVCGCCPCCFPYLRTKLRVARRIEVKSARIKFEERRKRIF